MTENKKDDGVVRCTTIKPYDVPVHILQNVSEGIHPIHKQCYERRVRMPVTQYENNPPDTPWDSNSD